MICAWLFVQVVFTVHYAQLYYGADTDTSRGGLDFNGDEKAMFDKSVGAVKTLIEACKGINSALA